MRKEKEIRERLQGVKEQHAETLVRFDEYDNSDDLSLLESETIEIEVLEWVLGE